MRSCQQWNSLIEKKTVVGNQKCCCSVTSGGQIFIPHSTAVPLINTDRHLSNIDYLKACTACLVCFIPTVNGHRKKVKEDLKDWH